VPAQALVGRIRALAPIPGAVLIIGGVTLRVLAGRAIPRNLAVDEVAVLDNRVLVGTGHGSLELLIVQPPGKRPMAADAWLRGLRTPPSDKES
jgi:methionyl-tRNA formyltransferase